MNNPEEITYFAETNARGQRVKFGIKAKDRTRHVYVIGKTGTGKTTMLENMAIQDIHNGNGLCFMDPHGTTADKLLEYIPEERKKDVLYFAPFDMEYPLSFNIMEDVGYDKRHLVVSGLMSAFKKIWQDAWSARMEYILSNTLFALLEYPDATLLSVNKMLADKKFRAKVVEKITDPSIRSFWVDEFANYTDRFAQEATPAIQNKVGQFTSNPLIRNIIGQPKSSFNLRDIMDQRKILIVNLSKGRIGESNANLLGSLLITKIYLSAMGRADLNEGEIAKLPNFYLYVDEFQSFANESFADILSEARKYKLNLTIAHQYIEQMVEEVRSAVFGNVGTMVTFRVGAFDAEYLEKEFAPTFTAIDIVNLGFAEVYLRLMIDGMGSKPFSAKTVLPDIEKSNLAQEVITESRRAFAFPRAIVEEKVKALIDDGKGENEIRNQKSENRSNNENRNSKFQSPRRQGNDARDISSRAPSPFTDNQSVIPEVRSQNYPGSRSNNSNKKPKEHKPFAGLEILEEVKSAPKPETPIEKEGLSLKELKKPQNGKSVTEDNRNSLKDILAKIQHDKQPEVDISHSRADGNPSLEKPETKKEPEVATPTPEPSNELTKEQLEKILEV
jgi:hypothetical protein